jgi:mutator protein MutT
MEQKYPRVGVGAVVLDQQGRILLQLRKKPPEANHWSIPGGRVEFMETVENAIVRELKEELGIVVEVVALLCVTNHIVPSDDAHWVSPAFHVRVVSGEASNLEPHATKEMRWFPISELPAELTVTTRSALTAYLERHPVAAGPVTRGT